MENLGQKISYKKLSDAEYQQALLEKIREESSEVKLGDKRDTLKELTDLLEAIETLAEQMGSDFDELRQFQIQRREERGGFDKHHFVERLDLADDDPWADYYANEPDRFKEVK